MVYMMQIVFFVMTILLFPAHAVQSLSGYTLKLPMGNLMRSFAWAENGRIKSEPPSRTQEVTLSQTEEESLQDLAKAIWKEAKGTDMRGISIHITDPEGRLLSLGRGEK